MQELLQSGRLLDAIIVLIVAEAVLLWWFDRRWGLATRATKLWPNLASGAVLMLCVRAAVTDSEPWLLLALLAAALVFHLIDLSARLRSNRADGH